MNKVFFYRLIFVLTSLQGGYALFSLLSIPKDPKKAFLFGLSYERLILIVLPLIIIAFGGYLFVKTWIDKDWIRRIDHKISVQLTHNHRLSLTLVVCGLFLIIGGIYSSAVSFGSFYVLAPPEHGLFSYMVFYVDQIYSLIVPYLFRLKPLILLLMGICAQIIIMLFVLTFDFQLWLNRLKTHNFFMIFNIYGALLILWKIIGWTHLKLSPDYTSSEWLALGTPILETQALLAFVVGCALIGTGILVKKLVERLRQPWRRFATYIDLVLVSIIMLTAIGYWSSFPAQDSKFFNMPRYPNYAYYPNSDAFTYDTTT